MSTERFVDQVQNPIPDKDTWGSLSVNQLIDVKSQLLNKAYDFRSNHRIASVLNESIRYLDYLISTFNPV